MWITKMYSEGDQEKKNSFFCFAKKKIVLKWNNEFTCDQCAIGVDRLFDAFVDKA